MSPLTTSASQVGLTENIYFPWCLNEMRHRTRTESPHIAITRISFHAFGFLRMDVVFKVVLKITSTDAFHVFSKSNFDIFLQFGKINRS
jgi:hypothetical protein